MRIVYYSSHPDLALGSPSGYGTHMREMIKAFEQAGHTVYPVIMGGTEAVPPVDDHKPHGKVHYKVKDLFKRLVPSFVWESMKDYLLLNKDLVFESHLTEKLARIKPDFVYERASYLQLSGIHAAQKNDIPHILEMNAPYVEERREHFSISSFFDFRGRSIEKQQLSESNSVVVVSQVLKAHFMQKHHLPAERFVVLPNAVDPEKVQVNQERVREIVAKCKFESRIVVGFVGSLFKWHGVDLLIRSIKMLKETGFNVALLIVGDGAIKPDLEELIRILELEQDVVITGNVPHEEVFSYIDVMNITVMANSNWYGSPVKLFEYGAMGKPVVAPGNGPVREVIAPEVDGLLVDNEFDLVRQLRRLMEHPDMQKRLAASFHRKVLREHTWEKNAEKVLEKAGALKDGLKEPVN